jgi:hypothetical protein
MSNPIKRRSPYAVRAGSSSPRYRPPAVSGQRDHWCKHCGGQTHYWPEMRGLYCNQCGTLEEDTDELKAQLEAEKLREESTFDMADGSAIYSPGMYSPSNIRKGKTIAVGSGKGHTTINMRDAITDKLRYRDGRTREMDQVFKAQDRQMESMGRTIKSDRVELKRSSNITSSDELRAERSSGTVGGLSGAGEYNPATGRRTRLSF